MVRIPLTAAELLAELTSIEFTVFTLDDLSDVLTKFDIAGNPVIFSLVLGSIALDFIMIILARYRWYRRQVNIRRKRIVKRQQRRQPAWIEKRKAEEHALHREEAQANVRAYLVARRAGIPLRALPPKYKQQVASLVIQRYARARPQRLAYQKKRQAAIKLQSFTRGCAVRKQLIPTAEKLPVGAAAFLAAGRSQKAAREQSSTCVTPLRSGLYRPQDGQACAGEHDKRHAMDAASTTPPLSSWLKPRLSNPVTPCSETSSAHSMPPLSPGLVTPPPSPPSVAQVAKETASVRGTQGGGDSQSERARSELGPRPSGVEVRIAYAALGLEPGSEHNKVLGAFTQLMRKARENSTSEAEKKIYHATSKKLIKARSTIVAAQKHEALDVARQALAASDFASAPPSAPGPPATTSSSAASMMQMTTGRPVPDASLFEHQPNFASRSDALNMEAKEVVTFRKPSSPAGSSCGGGRMEPRAGVAHLVEDTRGTSATRMSGSTDSRPSTRMATPIDETAAPCKQGCGSRPGRASKRAKGNEPGQGNGVQMEKAGRSGSQQDTSCNSVRSGAKTHAPRRKQKQRPASFQLAMARDRREEFWRHVRRKGLAHVLCLGAIKVKRRIVALLWHFVRTLQSEHTIVSALAPNPEDTAGDRIRDENVIHIFWTTMVGELCLLAALTGGASELLSLSTLINGAITTVILAFIGTVCKVTFRWGNRLRVKRRKRRFFLLRLIGAARRRLTARREKQIERQQARDLLRQPRLVYQRKHGWVTEGRAPTPTPLQWSLIHGGRSRRVVPVVAASPPAGRAPPAPPPSAPPEQVPTFYPPPSRSGSMPGDSMSSRQSKWVRLGPRMHLARYTAAWTFNILLFLVLCLFALAYGIAMGAPEVQTVVFAWIACLIFTWAIIEPGEVLALILFPQLANNDRIMACREKLKDLGIYG